MNSPKISVITIVLNDVSHIAETIESVISQKYQNLEYIIIDGGSIDGTLDVINNYRSFVDVLISEKDSGIYNAMNKGIKIAKGQIIGLINSGDSYGPGTFDAISYVWDAPREIVYYGNMSLLDENGEIVKKVTNTDHNNVLRRLNMSVPHPTMFVANSVYEKLGTYDESFRIGADFEFVIRCLKNGIEFNKIAHINSSFRLGGLSSTPTLKKRYESCVEVHLIHKKYQLNPFNVYYKIFRLMGGYVSMKILQKLGKLFR